MVTWERKIKITIRDQYIPIILEKKKLSLIELCWKGYGATITIICLCGNVNWYDLEIMLASSWDSEIPPLRLLSAGTGYQHTFIRMFIVLLFLTYT